jgi:hypothetical protein
VLLHGEEVDGDDELGREEHFDEEAAGDAGARRELVGDEERAWEQGVGDCGGGDARDDLGWEDEEATQRRYRADENKPESNLWLGVSC